jgi:vacuolar iron transporter family protein
VIPTGWCPVQLLPFLFVPGTRAIVTAVVSRALLSPGHGRGADRRALLRRGLRQLAIGVAAAAVTYGFGRVFGTVVG